MPRGVKGTGPRSRYRQPRVAGISTTIRQEPSLLPEGVPEEITTVLKESFKLIERTVGEAFLAGRQTAFNDIKELATKAESHPAAVHREPIKGVHHRSYGPTGGEKDIL